MKIHINYLGFLALPALLAIFAPLTGNTGLYGFLGFLYYLRYFFILPDELFLLQIRKAATAAWLTELALLAPLMALLLLLKEERALPVSFGLSFAGAIFVFTIYLMILEYRESRGAADD